MTYRTQKVLIFGGAGFLGRYVVQELLKQGYIVYVATRDIQKVHLAHIQAPVGRLFPILCDIKNKDLVAKWVDEADIVVNLIGILFESKGQNFSYLHRDFPAYLSQLCNRNGKQSRKRFVHISALGVDQAKTSSYARSKLKGEKLVHEHDKEATIIRPSVIFGPEDQFLNLFAFLLKLNPFFFLMGGGRTRFQPVYVGDVARVVALLLTQNKGRGEIIELGGSQIYSLKELVGLVASAMNKSVGFIPVPFAIAKPLAYLLNLLPVNLLTPDQVELLKYDNVVRKKSDLYESLHIEPVCLKQILSFYAFSSKDKA